MPLVRGCHVIKKGNVAEAMLIAPSIIEKGLLVNDPPWGIGAWAFPADLVPERFRHAPMVVFDVEDSYVKEKPLGILPDGKRNFNLQLRGGLNLYDYVPILILGFLNLPSFPAYQGQIGFRP